MRSRDDDSNDGEPNEQHDKDSTMNTEMSEQRLRKALGTVNDLEPPRDDLFAVRALNRGRARTARRRSVLLGAAAAVVVVAGVGGTWALSQRAASTSSASAGAAAASAPAESGEAAVGSAPPDSAAQAPRASSAVPLPATPDSNGRGTDSPPAGDLSAAARDTSRWLEGPGHGATHRLRRDRPPRWPPAGPTSSSGAYAADSTNTGIVVALVRPDPALESFVSGAMPSPSDVRFVTAANSLEGQAEGRVADRHQRRAPCAPRAST